MSRTSSSISVILADKQTFKLIIVDNPLSNLDLQQKRAFFANLWKLLDEQGFICIKAIGTSRFFLKIVLDIVLGRENCVNEVIIDSPVKNYHDKHLPIHESTGSLFIYSRSKGVKINPVMNNRVSGGYWHTFMSKRQGPSKTFTINGDKSVISPPPGTHWKLSQKRINEKCARGEIRLNSKGTPEYWVPLKTGQIIDNNWLDISSENADYMRSVYERVIQTFSAENDLIGIIESENIIGEMNFEENKRRIMKIPPSIIIENSPFPHLENQEKLDDTAISDLVDFKDLSDIPDSENEHDVISLDNGSTKTEYYSSDEQFSPDKGSSMIQSSWYNYLIHGDNIRILRALASDFFGKIQLIYIDPPHFTGLNQKIDFPALNSSIEDVAYRNIWENDAVSTKAFYSWLKARLLLMKRLLRNDGFIFIRFSFHLSHHAKMVMDSVFGEQNYLGEFLVRRMKKNLADKQKGNQVHLIVNTDSLFLYRMSDRSHFNIQVKKVKRKNGLKKEIVDSWDNIWLDIPGYQKAKKTLYPTENSEALLKRVVQLCSKEGDIVADFFAGSGTTLAIAEDLDRCWIGADIGNFSVHEIKKRMLRKKQRRSFAVFTDSKSEVKPINVHVELRVQQGKDKSITKRYLTGECYLRGNLLQVEQINPLVIITCRLEESSLLVGLNGYRIKTDEQENGILSSTDPRLTDLIDFWAVDWDYNGDYFQGRWFSSRNFIRRKISSEIETTARYDGNNKKNRCILIQIVDILGNRVKVDFEISSPN